MRINKLISAILTILLGVLLIVKKADVISIGITVLGIALLVSAILDFVRKKVVSGVIKIVLTILFVVLGWTLIEIALYILAAFLLIFGVLDIIGKITGKKLPKSLFGKIIAFVEPVISIAAGVCLLFAQGETLVWVFILTGIVLLVNGILALIEALVK